MTKEGPTRHVETSLPDGTRTLSLSFGDGDDAVELPKGSPFPDWRVARQFAGPMPFTFSPRPDGTFVVVEGSRSNWTPRPVLVTKWQVAMFEESPFCTADPILANAFMVEGISYRWEKGRILVPGGAS